MVVLAVFLAFFFGSVQASAEPYPALSYIISGEELSCAASLDCMSQIYATLAAEIKRQQPLCTEMWGYSGALRSGGEVRIAITVRCVRMLLTTL